jgi:hypothetical protein
MSCSNVSSNFCEAPANLDPPRTPRTRCVRCGQPVCKECSGIEPDEFHAGGKVRVCDECLGQETDGEARVMVRHYRSAGYPGFTLDRAIEIVAARDRHHHRGRPAPTRRRTPVRT